MYLDPPYPDNKCNYFHNMRDSETHEKMADKLNAAKCKWILSSYDKEDIRALYPDSFIVPIQSFSGMKAKKGGVTRVPNEEILVMNFIPKDLETLASQNYQAESQTKLDLVA